MRQRLIQKGGNFFSWDICKQKKVHFIEIYFLLFKKLFGLIENDVQEVDILIVSSRHSSTQNLGLNL